MAVYTTAKLWEAGELDTTPGASTPSFKQRMEWKMRGGKRSVEEGCPEKAFHEITYSDPCSYAAYELGAWGLAYLQNKAGEGKVVGVGLEIGKKWYGGGSNVHAPSPF